MALTTQSEKSVARLKLMEAYPILSSNQRSAPSSNQIEEDLMTEELFHELDDMTAMIVRQDAPDASSAKPPSKLAEQFDSLLQNSPLFNKPSNEIAVIMQEYSDHLQKLVEETNDAIEVMDVQFAREANDAKLAFDIDEFRLEKIYGDLENSYSIIEEEEENAKRLFQKANLTEKEVFQLEKASVAVQNTISQSVSSLKQNIFKAESELKHFDVTSRLYLDIECECCCKRCTAAALPFIIVPCGHTICQSCIAENFYFEGCKIHKCISEKCPVCEQQIEMLCPDKVMVERVREMQLDSNELIKGAQNTLSECGKIVEAYQ